MWYFISSLASPKKFFYLTDKLMPVLIAFFILSTGYGLWGALVASPADNIQGEGFRIIYIHAPCAFMSLFVYAVMATAALSSLIWRLKLAPLVMQHSAPIGAGFTFLTLITGSLWGKPMWGTWWLWDARLTSELILLFLYLAIILFQTATENKRYSAHAQAVLILVGFMDIPIIHYSVNWWNTLHQGATLKLFSPSAMDTSMIYPLLSLMVAFLLYYMIVLCMRMRYTLIVTQSHFHWLKHDE
jgi:heme exporter protein C